MIVFLIVAQLATWPQIIVDRKEKAQLSWTEEVSQARLIKADAGGRAFTMAAERLGYNGYFSGAKMMDLAGLVFPQMIELTVNSSSNARAFHEMLKKYGPDYLILRNFEISRNIYFLGGVLFEIQEERDHFQASYEVFRRGGKYTVYRRRE